MVLVVSMMIKSFQKCLISSLFVWPVTMFNPNVVASVSTTVRVKQFQAVVSYLMESKMLSAKDCDKTTVEFNTFWEKELKKLNEEFKFDQNTHHLGDFYFKEVGVQTYISISFVLRLLLTPSHGQTTGERV